jgi:hypothetical protein
MDIPVGKELDTAIALAFPELKAQFVKGARSGETSVREGSPMSLEECREACKTAEPWAGVPFAPVTTTPFSTEIAAAWKIMERFTTNDPVTDEGYSCSVLSGVSCDEDKPWIARINHSLWIPTWAGLGATGAEAICRAALDVLPHMPEIAARQERYIEQWKVEYPERWTEMQAESAAVSKP